LVIVLMRQNVADFAKLCSELVGWGITEITYNQLGGRDRPEFYAAHRLRSTDVNLLEVQLPETRQRLSDRGATLVGGEEYVTRIRASALNERVSIEDCEPGERFLFIDEVGRVSPCSFTTLDYGVDIRTITTAADLAFLPGIFRKMRDTKRSEQCDDCLSTQACGKFNRSSGETLRT
jgi:radical SAM protein with 4Fe4S-binding SPASM domain